jgi:hypothetical protein
MEDEPTRPVSLKPVRSCGRGESNRELQFLPDQYLSAIAQINTTDGGMTGRPITVASTCSELLGAPKWASGWRVV